MKVHPELLERQRLPVVPALHKLWDERYKSIREFEKHLAKVGLKYSDGPTMKGDGSGFAFIDAPEGYEIELMQRTRTDSGNGY